MQFRRSGQTPDEAERKAVCKCLIVNRGTPLAQTNSEEVSLCDPGVSDVKVRLEVYLYVGGKAVDQS